jgi:lipopolysaccharide/colanic/teichoic acid biosynthesis glycosyltransferase
MSVEKRPGGHHTMHYKEFIKAQGEPLEKPMADLNFYEDLRRIAKRRPTVLEEIERLAFRAPTAFDAGLSRMLDILLGVLGVIVCAIPVCLIGIAIFIDSPGPIFYFQRRVGKDGRVFWMVKFRTMFFNAEKTTGPIWATEKDPRVTRVGAFLRQSHLDEIPQLFNILKGDMAFVGPRPERPEFVYWFTQFMPAFDRRHAVKPGITGVAQLRNGYDNSARSVYRKLRWDVYYIKKKSLQTDLHILWRTVIPVFRMLIFYRRGRRGR